MRLLPDPGSTSGDFVTDSDWGEDMGDSVGGYSGSSLETCFRQEERSCVAWTARWRGWSLKRSSLAVWGSLQSHTVRRGPLIVWNLRPALTFHCREIPSWLKGQQGYSQVDELKGERVGGGKKSGKADGTSPQIKLVRKREWREPRSRRQLYSERCQLCGSSGQGACAKPMIGMGWDLDQMTCNPTSEKKK